MGIFEINLMVLGIIFFAVIAGLAIHYTLENLGIIWTLVVMAALLIAFVNVLAYFFVNTNL